MIYRLLEQAGIPAREARFSDPPDTTYAVFFVDTTMDGSDDSQAAIHTHDVTVELYESAFDDEAETSLEAVLTGRGYQWTKQGRYWLDSIRRYQVVYEFTYRTKSYNPRPINEEV